MDGRTLTREKIDAAARLPADGARATRVVLSGSYASGDAREDPDVDFIVIEPVLEDRAREMVRQRRLLRPLRIPVDVLVHSTEEVNRWGHQPGSALREGRLMDG